MKIHRFRQYIDALRELNRKEKALHDLGIDMEGFDGYYDDVIDPLLRSLFTREQRETLEWWLYDAPDGIECNPKTVHMWEKDETPIPLLNEEQLHAYLFTPNRGKGKDE